MICVCWLVSTVGIPNVLCLILRDSRTLARLNAATCERRTYRVPCCLLDCRTMEASDCLLGRSVGGLAGVKLRFRPQLFWQELLPEHVVSSRHLQFNCDMATGRNYARLPSETSYSAHGEYAFSMAHAVPDTDADPAAAHVARALREAATFQESLTPLRHLISSCYCTRDTLAEALTEVARQGNIEGCELLLRAGADPRATPHGKTALHVAVEEGHEPVARALAKADPITLTIECYGCTPVKLARDRDMAGLARRLEAHAQEALSARAMATDNSSLP